MDIDLIEGDTGSKLVAACTDNDTGLPIDFTGQTATLRYQIGAAAIQEKTMTIQSPATAGLAEYQFLAGEALLGDLIGQIKIADGSGKTITQLGRFALTVGSRL